MQTSEQFIAIVFTDYIEILMDKAVSSHEFIASLTPHEKDVLRKRFGIVSENADSGSDYPPPSDEDDNGSGGVPAAPNALDR